MSANSPDNDPLDDLLRSWRVDASLPPGFLRAVWLRIHAVPASPKLFLQALSSWIASALPRPALAATYIIALIVIGISLGWGQARQDNTRLKTELSERYVHVLAPYLVAHTDR